MDTNSPKYVWRVVLNPCGTDEKVLGRVHASWEDAMLCGERIIPHGGVAWDVARQDEAGVRTFTYPLPRRS